MHYYIHRRDRTSLGIVQNHGTPTRGIRIRNGVLERRRTHTAAVVAIAAAIAVGTLVIIISAPVTLPADKSIRRRNGAGLP